MGSVGELLAGEMVRKRGFHTTGNRNDRTLRECEDATEHAPQPIASSSPRYHIDIDLEVEVDDGLVGAGRRCDSTQITRQGCPRHTTRGRSELGRQRHEQTG